MSEAVYAHYFHVLGGDQAAAEPLWTYLAERYAVQSNKEAVAVGATPSSGKMNVSCSLQGEKARICLLPLPGVTTVELFWLPGSQGGDWQGAEKEIDDIRLQAGSRMDDVFAEARVFIGSETETSGLLASRQAAGDDDLPASPHKLQGGTIYHLSDVAGVPTYVFEPAQSLKALKVLTDHLPAIDGVLQKLGKIAVYFHSQREVIDDERVAANKQLSVTLHAQVVKPVAGHAWVSALEEQIEQLATIYGKLASDASIIKDAHFTIVRELAAIDTQLRAVSPPGEPVVTFVDDVREEYTALAQRLRQSGELLVVPTNQAATAIDVLRAEIDILHSRQNLELQEEGLALQVGAGFVEFILVFYYSLGSWGHLAGLEHFEAVSALSRGLLVFAFAASVVAATHQAGQYATGKAVGLWRLAMALAVPVVIVGIMLAVTVSAE